MSDLEKTSVHPAGPTTAKDGKSDAPEDARGTYGQPDFSPAAQKSKAQTERATSVPHISNGKQVPQKSGSSGA